MASAPLRWGIASTGRISFDFTNAIQMLPTDKHQVTGVGARKLESAQAFAAEFNIPKAYGSYEELMKAADVDVVYVGSIHPTHFSIAYMALQAGKHVMCEKPLTLSLQHTETLINLATQKGLFLLEGYWSRFFPIYQHLREEIASGTIGDVRLVNVNFGADLISKDRMVSKVGGGGALLDLGCYPTQLFTMIYGEKPHKIVASGFMTDESTGGDEGVDVFDSVTCFYSKNRIGQFNVHMGCNLNNKAYIHGSKGTIEMDTFWCPTTLIVPVREDGNEVDIGPARGKNLTKKYEVPLGKAPKPMNHGNSEGFVYEIECVRQCILKGEVECSLMSHEHSRIIGGILDEVRQQCGIKYDQYGV